LTYHFPNIKKKKKIEARSCSSRIMEKTWVVLKVIPRGKWKRQGCTARS